MVNNFRAYMVGEKAYLKHLSSLLAHNYISSTENDYLTLTGAIF